MERYIARVVPNATLAMLHVSDFERQFLTMENVALEFKDAVEYKPNLVVMFFGANVSWEWAEEIGFDNATEIFGEAYERLRNALAGGRNVDFFHVQGFYDKPHLDKAKENVAKKCGDKYVLLNDNIRFNQDFRGLYNHPNDAGMKAIADHLWDSIKTAVEKYR